MKKEVIATGAAELISKTAKKLAMGAVSKKFILTIHDIEVPEAVKKAAQKR